MLDSDLATPYQVETKQLKRQVRRNSDRFPLDFMFELIEEEFNNFRSHFGTSSWDKTRNMPLAFTEQGIALFSILIKSNVVIKVNIQIIRTFIKMRELLLSNKGLLLEMEKIRKRISGVDLRVD